MNLVKVLLLLVGLVLIGAANYRETRKTARRLQDRMKR
jgi:hypothetical protein